MCSPSGPRFYWCLTVRIPRGPLDVEAAKDKVDLLRARVVDGDTKVGSGDIAKARAELEYAELRAELATDTDDHKRRQADLTTATGILDSFTDGPLYAKAAHLIEREAAARQALDDLYQAATDYADEARTATTTVRTLGTVPDTVQVTTHGLAPTLHLHGRPVEATRQNDYSGRIIAGALYRALKPRLPRLHGRDKDLYEFASTTAGLAGGIHDEKRTQTEQLAAFHAALTESER